MSEILYMDEWSSIHLVANLCLGLFSGAKHYSFPKSLAVITAIGILWEIIEYISHESEEHLQDQVTDMLLNTIGFSAGYFLGHELKK